MISIAYKVLKERSCTKRSPCEPILGKPRFEGLCRSATAILRVNYQLYREACEVLYHENKFFIDQDSALRTFVNGPSRYQMLRSLTINLTPALFCGTSTYDLWNFRHHLRSITMMLTGLDTLRLITKVRWGGDWLFTEIWNHWLRDQRHLLLFAGYVPLRHPKLDATHWSAKTKEKDSEQEVGLHIRHKVQMRHEVDVCVSITSVNARKPEASVMIRSNANGTSC